MSNTIRTFEKRDSATAALRKLGVHKDFYARFITKDGDQYSFDQAAVDVHIAGQTSAAKLAGTEAPKVEEPAKKDRTIKKDGTPRSKVTGKTEAGKILTVDSVTCTSVAKSMIRAGKTNDEVWTVIKAQFNLDDKKKGYPAWYRKQLRDAGEKV